MARGQAMPRPFMLRWFAPRLLGADPNVRWLTAARISFAACCVLGALYCWNIWALAIPLGLAGLTVQLRCPVLVDLHAMALALCSATLAVHGYWWAAIPFALLAGATKETAPAFAAAWAWSPILLLGLVAPMVRMLISKPGPDPVPGDTLSDPIRKAINVHRAQPFAWFVLPLGVLVFGLVDLTPQVAVVLALAYGQCLVAQDLVRLYTWCWPALAAQTFDVVPAQWWALLIVAHILNPWKGPGW